MADDLAGTAVLFDLDGTLLNKNLELSKNAIVGLKKIAANNIGISIVSARMLNSIDGYVEGIETNFISALNGSIIYNCISLRELENSTCLGNKFFSLSNF